MLAVTTVWRIHGVDGVLAAPAELDMLRVVAAEPRAIAFQVSPPRRLATARLLEMLTLESTVRSQPRTVRSNDPTVSVFPSMPAGRYRVRLEGGGSAGWLMLGIGQDQFALRSEALVWPHAPIDIEFPVAVRALIVRGDEDARRAIRKVIVEPLSIVPSSARLTDLVARRAVKYRGRRRVLSRRSQLRRTRGVLDRRKPAVDVCRAIRPAATVNRSVAAQRARRQSPDARSRSVAGGADAGARRGAASPGARCARPTSRAGHRDYHLRISPVRGDARQ